MERAHRIQQFSRLAGRDLDEVGRSGKELYREFPAYLHVFFTNLKAAVEYTNYCLDHDEWENTAQALRAYLKI